MDGSGSRAVVFRGVYCMVGRYDGVADRLGRGGASVDGVPGVAADTTEWPGISFLTICDLLASNFRWSVIQPTPVDEVDGPLSEAKDQLVLRAMAGQPKPGFVANVSVLHFFVVDSSGAVWLPKCFDDRFVRSADFGLLGDALISDGVLACATAMASRQTGGNA